MLYVLLIIGIIFILGMFWLLYEAKHAPVAYEDEEDFFISR